MKTISLYELLGLFKDKKAPKKILIKDKIYYLLEKDDEYVYSQNSHDLRDWDNYIDNKINISQCLDLDVLILEDNNEVEIIEEDKKIEKINDILRVNDLEPPYDCNLEKIWIQTIKNHNKINELIDKVKKLKKEGNK